MKTQNYLFIIFLSLLTCYQAKAQNNYKIIINGEPFDITLDNSFTYITENGDQVEFRVLEPEENQKKSSQKEEKSSKKSERSKQSNQYSSDLVSFDYIDNYGIASSEPISGLTQTTMHSGTGGVILVQEFSTIATTELVSQFLTSLVGAKQAASSKPVKQQISGKNVNGLYALDEDGNQTVVYVYANQNKSVYITLMGSEEHREDFLEFLKNFKLKF